MINGLHLYPVIDLLQFIRRFKWQQLIIDGLAQDCGNF